MTQTLTDKLKGNGGAPAGAPTPPADAQAPVATPSEATYAKARVARGLVEKMAAARCIEPNRFYDVILRTCMPENATIDHVAALLLIADKYGLDPLTRQIQAIKTKGGGIQIVVPIDGWAKIVNDRPECDGWEFEDHLDDKGKVYAITCRHYRKDRSHPCAVREYMDECRGQTHSEKGAVMPWGKWEKRLLRHKAFSQSARLAYGINDILDPDEADRWHQAGALAEPPRPAALPAAEDSPLQIGRGQFDIIPAWTPEAHQDALREATSTGLIETPPEPPQAQAEPTQAPAGEIHEPCQECKATGKIKGGPCAECHGTGHITLREPGDEGPTAPPAPKAKRTKTLID